MAKLRFLFLLLFLAVAGNAQRSWTVAEVETFVKSQMKLGADRDHATADYLLKNIKLKEKLDDRTVEEWQGQGVGHETIRALRKLAMDSAALPAPPPVVVVAPPPPPKPPSAEEIAATLAAIKEYALNYTTSLPNYVCIQTTRRKQSPSEGLRARGYIGNGDTIQETLTFFEHKESYKVMLYNGVVTNKSHDQLGGTRSSGEFGSMLSNIFEPDSGAEFAWERWATLDKHRMYVFSYRIPKSNGYSMADEEVHREYTSAYRGLIYADHDTKTIMRVTLDTEGIPADFPIHEVHIQLDYDHTKIADQEFILPLRYLLTSKADKVDTENIADFHAYRKYGADSTIIFDEAPTPEERFQEQPDAPSAAPAKPTPPPGKK
jgi:hypothetical protein